MTIAATDNSGERRKWSLMRAVRWAFFGLLGILVAFAAAVFLIANSQDGSVRVLQSYLYWQWKDVPNTFEPRAPARDFLRDDGLRVRTNIGYGMRYPNSYLDIWSAPANDRAKRPTAIYLHGGGWFMGSKDMGDPMAAASTANEPMVSLAKHGFNVVNLDYALAPDYRYPVPVIQLNDAITFLSEHSAEYGLDMTNIVIMGGSAGAQIAAQYGVLLSDAAYAADMGIKPAVDRSRVKALVVFSAPLKSSGFEWRMNTMWWAYLGTQDLVNSRQAQQVDILSHINAAYPAVYLTDGNQPDTFQEHAKAMARLLAGHNVDHEFNYYDVGVAPLGHDYTGRLDTKYGRENLDKAIAFMARRANPDRDRPGAIQAEP